MTPCNLKCPYCYYVTEPNKHKKQEITLNSFPKILDLLDKLNFSEICFTGGEPILREDIFKFIGTTRNHGFLSSLITNGTLITHEIAEKLSSYGLEKAFVSLDDIDPCIHNKLRGQLDKTLEGIRNLIHAGISTISITCVLTRMNMYHIKNIYEFTRKLGIGINFQPAYIPKGDRSFEDLSFKLLDQNELDYVINQLDEWAEISYRNNYLELIKNYYEKKSTRPKNCQMGKDAVIIDSDGRIYPCFHRHDLGVGNVLNDNNEDIKRDLLKIHEKVKCATCFGDHCISLFNIPDSELSLT